MRLSNKKKQTLLFAIQTSSTDFLNKSENKKLIFINFVKNQLDINIDPCDIVEIRELYN